MRNTRSKSCYTCLSEDRNTWPLKEFSHIYIKLIDKSKSTMLNQRHICWECRAVLRKIQQFINKATYAQSILSSRARNNKKCLSTLKYVRRFKTFKINFERNELNKENSLSEYEEDYDSIMKKENGLPSQKSILDCNIDDTNTCDNNIILDESFIKTKNREMSDNYDFDRPMSSGRYSGVDNSKDNKALEFKVETSYNTNLNNVEDHQDTKYDSDDFYWEHCYEDEDKIIINKDENNMNDKIYDRKDEIILMKENVEVPDSEDEMIISKKTNNKMRREESRKRRENLTIQSEVNTYSINKKYIRNDSPIKFEDTYKIVPLTDQEEEDWLKIERMDVTFNVNEFKCEKCILHWKSRKQLLSHNSSFHNKMTDYKCVYCDAYYLNKFTLHFHQDSRHCKLYVCVFCNTKYHTRNTMYDHYDEKHNNTFQCKECPVSFGKIILVREHYKQMHQRFECDYCKKVHPTKLKLTKHIRNNHLFLCNICNKQCSTNNQLYYHKETTHKTKEDETTFCVECNKQFDCVLRYKLHFRYSDLHRRLEGVSFDTRAACPVCNKVYASKNHMTKHYNFEHLKIYNFTCNICNKSFPRKTSLDNHKNRVHLGLKPPKNKICNICGRGFGTLRILKHHIRTHTGERPFECPHCPSRFAQKVARNVHVKKLHPNTTATANIHEEATYYKFRE